MDILEKPFLPYEGWKQFLEPARSSMFLGI